MDHDASDERDFLSNLLFDGVTDPVGFLHAPQAHADFRFEKSIPPGVAASSDRTSTTAGCRSMIRRMRPRVSPSIEASSRTRTAAGRLAKQFDRPFASEGRRRMPQRGLYILASCSLVFTQAQQVSASSIHSSADMKSAHNSLALRYFWSRANDRL